MFLLDKPFVSDFLLRTIRENNFDLVSTEAARELIHENSLSWIDEEDAIRLMKEQPGRPIYTNSENALTWISTHLGDSALSERAQLFKDKARFRELVKDIYPGFFFKTIKLEDIQDMDLNGLAFPFVIKPSVGFFSIGVHVVKNEADWRVAKEELNIQNLKSIYPPGVLNTSTFIIEEYVDGEEYAVDCYFDGEGKAVVLSILHHRFASGADTSDRVYTTSRDIIQEYKEAFGDFLQSMGEKAGLKNFPAHVELRVDAKGQIKPIEINPVRFGGWCTTADLMGITLDLNLYEYFHHQQKPDWEHVFKEKGQNKYSIVVLNNNSGFAPDEIDQFNYDLLAGDFQNPLLIRKLDVKKYSVFGFVFAETGPNHEQELDRILVSDLKKYISPV